MQGAVKVLLCKMYIKGLIVVSKHLYTHIFIHIIVKVIECIIILTWKYFTSYENIQHCSWRK